MSAGMSSFEARLAQFHADLKIKGNAAAPDAASEKLKKLAVAGRRIRFFNAMGRQKSYANSLTDYQVNRFMTLCDMQMKGVHGSNNLFTSEQSILSTNAMTQRGLPQSRTPPDLGGTSSVHFSLALLPPDSPVNICRPFGGAYTYVRDLNKQAVLKIHPIKLSAYRQPLCMKFGHGDEVVYMTVTTTTCYQVLFSFAHRNGTSNVVVFHHHTLQAEGEENILILSHRLMEIIIKNVGGNFEYKMNVNSQNAVYLSNFINRVINYGLLFEVTTTYVEPISKMNLIDVNKLVDDKEGAVSIIRKGDNPETLDLLFRQGLSLDINIGHITVAVLGINKPRSARGQAINFSPLTLIAYAVFLQQEGGENRSKTIKYLLEKGAVVSDMHSYINPATKARHYPYNIETYLESRTFLDDEIYRVVQCPANLRDTNKTNFFGIEGELNEAGLLFCNIREELSQADRMPHNLSALLSMLSPTYQQMCYPPYIKAALKRFPRAPGVSYRAHINVFLGIRVALLKVRATNGQPIFNYYPYLLRSAGSAHEFHSFQDPSKLPKSVQTIIDHSLELKLPTMVKHDPSQGHPFTLDPVAVVDNTMKWPDILKGPYTINANLSDIIKRLLDKTGIFSLEDLSTNFKRYEFQLMFQPFSLTVNNKLKLALCYLLNPKNQYHKRLGFQLIDQVYLQMVMSSDLSSEHWKMMCFSLFVSIQRQYQNSLYVDFELACFGLLDYINKQSSDKKADMSFFTTMLENGIHNPGLIFKWINVVNSVVKNSHFKHEGFIKQDQVTLALLIYLKRASYNFFLTICRFLNGCIEKLSDWLKNTVAAEVAARWAEIVKKNNEDDFEQFRLGVISTDSRSVMYASLMDGSYGGNLYARVKPAEILTMALYSDLKDNKVMLEAVIKQSISLAKQEQDKKRLNHSEYLMVFHRCYDRLIKLDSVVSGRLGILDSVLALLVNDYRSVASLLILKLKELGWQDKGLRKEIKACFRQTTMMGELLSQEIQACKALGQVEFGKYEDILAKHIYVPNSLALMLFVSDYKMWLGLEAYERDHNKLLQRLNLRAMSNFFKHMKEAYFESITRQGDRPGGVPKAIVLEALNAMPEEKLMHFVSIRWQAKCQRVIKSMLRLQAVFYEAKAAATLIQGSQNNHSQTICTSYNGYKARFARQLNVKINLPGGVRINASAIPGFYAARLVIKGHERFAFLDGLYRQLCSSEDLKALAPPSQILLDVPSPVLTAVPPAMTGTAVMAPVALPPVITPVAKSSEEMLADILCADTAGKYGISEAHKEAGAKLCRFFIMLFRATGSKKFITLDDHLWSNMLYPVLSGGDIEKLIVKASVLKVLHDNTDDMEIFKKELLAYRGGEPLCKSRADFNLFCTPLYNFWKGVSILTNDTTVSQRDFMGVLWAIVSVILKTEKKGGDRFLSTLAIFSALKKSKSTLRPDAAYQHYFKLIGGLGEKRIKLIFNAAVSILNLSERIIEKSRIKLRSYYQPRSSPVKRVPSSAPLLAPLPGVTKAVVLSKSIEDGGSAVVITNGSQRAVETTDSDGMKKRRKMSAVATPFKKAEKSPKVATSTRSIFKK